jgi:hypothetical protein
VVRIADEIVVDLMARACRVEYADAARDIVNVMIGGASVPVASLATLIRTKDTVRPSEPPIGAISRSCSRLVGAAVLSHKVRL